MHIHMDTLEKASKPMVEGLFKSSTCIHVCMFVRVCEHAFIHMYMYILACTSKIPDYAIAEDYAVFTF